MKNKTFWGLVFICSIFSACNNNDSKNHSGKTAKGVKNSSTASVEYICDVSMDTILLLTKGPAIMLTTNSGEKWSVIKRNSVLNQITVDDKNAIWGIYYWPGIHEPGGSMLLKSEDWGKTWKTYEFNIKKFAPEKIVSGVHERLRVRSGSKIFELFSDNPLTGFKKASISADIKDDDIESGYSSIDTNNRVVIYKINNGKKGKVLTLDSVGALNNLIKVKDTLFVAGDGELIGDSYKPYLSAVVGNKLFKKYNVPGHALKISKGYKNRIWAIAGGGLYLKTDTGLRKVTIY